MIITDHIRAIVKYILYDLLLLLLSELLLFSLVKVYFSNIAEKESGGPRTKQRQYLRTT